MTARFLLPLLTLFLISSTQAREDEIVIGTKTLQKMRFGIDFERLWFWSGGLNDEERDQIAQWSVVDTNADYVRVAINAGYELEEGKFNPKAYTSKIIPMMKEMKEAKPEIKFFASPRPLNEIEKKTAWQPYPRWITGDTKKNGNFALDAEKCAQYLERYILLMKEQGFKISFLDITNEWQSNDRRSGRMTGEDVLEISNYLEEHLDEEDMPLIVGPSSWNYEQGSAWLHTLNSHSKRQALDIASSHNTNRTGTPFLFVKTAHRVLGKDVEVWNTELHGWKSTSKENEVTSFYYMLEAIRAGFSGINGWLALGTEKQGHSYILSSKGKPVPNVKYFLFKKISSTSNYGHALDIVKEPKQLDYSAALIKDDLMTVWVINKSDEEVPLKITPQNRTIKEREITRTRWTDAKDVEGFEKILTLTSNRSLTSTIPAQSVCCFEIPLNP